MDGMSQGSGINCITAIMPFDGHNQEDSICISQGFIDRGGFRTLDYKTFVYSGSEKIGKDIINQPYCRTNRKLFHHCDDDGLPTPGHTLKKNDIIVAKENGDEEEPEDTSVKAKDKQGVVDKVLVGTGRRRRKGEGESSCKINISTYEMRIPEVGDKFAVSIYLYLTIFIHSNQIQSRHAQKGILAYIVPEEDLPFVPCGPNAGVKPDIIMSPHAIP